MSPDMIPVHLSIQRFFYEMAVLSKMIHSFYIEYLYW